mgnify:CR=1 FL=1
MAKERFIYFKLGLEAWLRGSADLVSLTGHSASDPRIYEAADKR